MCSSCHKILKNISQVCSFACLWHSYYISPHSIICPCLERLAHLHSSWLVSEATSFPWHLAEQGFDTWHKMTTTWKASWDLSQWENHDIPTSPKVRKTKERSVNVFYNWHVISFTNPYPWPCGHGGRGWAYCLLVGRWIIIKSLKDALKQAFSTKECDRFHLMEKRK